MFTKQAESDITGEPSVFQCTGCGKHLWLVGHKFMVTSSLHTKDDAYSAIKLLQRNSALSSIQVNKLKTDLEKLDFSPEPSSSDLLRELFGLGGVRIALVR